MSPRSSRRKLGAAVLCAVSFTPLSCTKDEPQSPPPAVPGQYPAYPAQQGAYPAQQGAYPAQQGAYPAQQGAYPAQQGAYPAQQGAYPAQPQPGAAPAYPATPGAGQPAAPGAGAQAAGGTSQPAPMALACQSDVQCLTHRCNTQVQKCAWPCQSNADCQSGFQCVGIACIPNVPPQVPPVQ